MINLFKVHMPPTVDKPLLDVLHSGYITQGAKVEEFEQKFADTFGWEKDQIVSVNSGTSALTLALRLAGVGAGDEVITTPMTCSATNLPILALGATPVFADVDPASGLILPADIEGRITSKTKAIMGVDWGGAPVDVAELNAIAQSRGIKVIIDAAHALGTHHNDTPDFLCYSLQAIKHITTGDGGVLVCASSEDAERGRKLRWFGISRDAESLDSRISEDITEWGYKFHMNDVAATIGIVQLEYVGDILARHQANAAYMFNNLDKDYFKHTWQHGSTYWIYTVTLPDRETRDAFKAYANVAEVQVSEVHRRNDEYSVFKPFANKVPGLDQFASCQVSLPVHWGLTAQECQQIVEVCNRFAAADRMQEKAGL